MARKKRLRKKRRFDAATKTLVKRGGGSDGGTRTSGPSAAERREHEGRTPQPGVPAGERNTQHPSASGYEYSPETYAKTGLTPPTARGVFDTTLDAPTPAEYRAQRKAERRTKRALQLLKDADLPGSDLTDSPQFAYLKASTEGKFPPKKLETKHPRAYKKAEKAAFAYLSEKEGLKPDPFAELAIDVLATKGVGSLAGKVGGKLAGSLGGKLASTEATVAESAAEKGVKGALRGLTKTPAKAKRVSQAARTAKGRKVIKAAEGQRIAKAGRRVAKKPVRTSLGVQAGALPLGIETPGTERAGALVQGTGEAIVDRPVDTGLATGKGIIGAVTSPLALGRAGVESLTTGNPEPFEETAREQVQGVLGLGEELLSGDPERVKKTVAEDVGVSYALPLVSVTRTKAWKKGKTKVRKGANVARGKAAKLTGSQRIRVVPPEKAGETYVLAPLERRAARRRVSEQAASAVAADRLQAEYHQKQILSELRKAPQPRSLRNVKGMEAGDLLQTLAEYGIRDLQGARVVRARGPVGKGQKGRVTLKAALDFVEAHPEILTDKHFKKALDAYTESVRQLPAAKANKGRRAAVMAQGDLFSILRPEDRVPVGARPYTKATTREGAWRELRTSQKAAAAMRRKARDAGDAGDAGARIVFSPKDRVAAAELRPGDQIKIKGKWERLNTVSSFPGFPVEVAYRGVRLSLPKDRVMAVRQGKKSLAVGSSIRRPDAERLYRQAKDLERETNALGRQLSRYSRPGQALKAGSRRKYYDKAILREYEAEVARAREGAGLAAPAWTHHQEFREPGAMSPEYPTAAARVQHMRSGTLAADDLVDRSLSALISGSVVNPRLRAGGQKLAREFTEAEMMPVKVGGKTKHVVTQKEWSDALRERQYSARDYVLFPARQFKQAILDPFRTQDEAAGIAGQALEKGLRVESPRSKYVVVRREAAKEFSAQIDPRKGAFEAFVNNASKGVSRWLLFSPAWAAIQSVAEAVPMAMAHPSLLSPAKLVKLERAIYKNSKVSPDEARAFAAAAGEAPTALHTPSELRLDLDSNPHGIFSDGARALTKNPIGRAAWSTARLRPFAEFDKWRTGKYRELLAAAVVDKELNSWYSSLKSILRVERRISDELRHLPRHEQLAAITKPKYKKDLDYVARHVNNLSGNWRAFTRYERSIAPFIVFYPFVRYSLRWPLTFAKHHPVAAEVSALLSAQNAEQIEKLLGHAPANPLAYAIPVWQGELNEDLYNEYLEKGMDKDEAEYKARSHMIETGQRAAPGLSAPTQAVVSGEPSQLLSTFNPLLGAGFTAATGINPYFGEQEPERGRQAADLLVQLSPMARFFGLDATDVANAIPGVDIETDEESPASKRFKEIDPRKRARSFFEPWADMSAAQFKAKEDFSGGLNRKYNDPISNVWDNPDVYPALIELVKNHNPGPYKKLLREHEASEKASDYVKSQEEKFYDQAEEELNPRQQDRFNEALQKLQGGNFIPEDDEKKPTGGGSIGGTSLGGGIGGAGGQGRIGGRPLGRIGGQPLGGKPPKIKAVAKLPKIEGVDLPGEATEFAQYLAHYTKLDPQFVGAWVKSEGGGFANGGEAGENNWLGVGYPGEQTAFSQSPFFNADAKTAAKATADWMKGKIGGEFNYAAAQGIKEIIPKAAGKGAEAAVQALAESGWGTNVEHVATNLAGVSAVGTTTASPTAKKRKGEWAGTKDILLRAARGIEVSSEKRTPAENAAVGGSATSDHLTTNANSFATDLPASGAALNRIGSTVAKRLGVKGWSPGNFDRYSSPKYPGYSFQILSEVDGHFDHVHVGAEWTGEDLPAGTISGGSSAGPSSVTAVSGAAVTSYAAATGQPVDQVKQQFKEEKITPQEIYKQLEALGVGIAAEPQKAADTVLRELQKSYRKGSQ